MDGALKFNAVRLVDTALRNHCGFAALLRLPGVAVGGSDAEQLGLSSPQFQDVLMGPGVWRKSGVDTALLVGASSVAELVGSTGFVSAESMFEAAAGVVVEDVLYTITDSQPIVSGGIPCGYRLSVALPVRG